MEDDRSSRTAERVAERRAAHQVLDTPKVFDDPLALRIIDPHVARRIEEHPREFDTVFDRYLRAFVSMRSRFAEDALGTAYARGVRQYVLIGAGFDTFAYRNPYPDLHVWEVDHPATQAVKRARLEGAGIHVPSTVTLATADLSRIPLRDALSDARFDPMRPAFFAWLGVVMYLESPDIRTTLRFIASLPPGSGVALDYAVPPESLNWISAFLYKRVLARVASIGEPFKTFWDALAATTELRDAGFATINDLGPDDINTAYFNGRRDGLKVGPSGRVVTALV